MARPSTAPIRKQVSLPSVMATAIDDFRFDRRIGSESEAIRILIERGLEVEAQETARRAGARKQDVL